MHSCNFLLSSTLNEKLLDINIPKQQLKEQTQIVNIDVWTHPSRNFSIFGRSNSHHNYRHIGFACKLQLKRSTVNHIRDSNFSVCKHHSLCIVDVNYAKILLFVRLWREFIVNLWVNWNSGMLVELFPISRLQHASSQSVRAVSVRFAPVRNCIMSGIMLLDYTETIWENFQNY